PFLLFVLANSSIRDSGVFFLLQVAKLILQFAIYIRTKYSPRIKIFTLNSQMIK
ncbi:hypothetical protein HNQ37_001628, partial [Lactovum miscens]|nr:hypothetical protein [Lactovum miscens]